MKLLFIQGQWLLLIRFVLLVSLLSSPVFGGSSDLPTNEIPRSTCSQRLRGVWITVGVVALLGLSGATAKVGRDVKITLGLEKIQKAGYSATVPSDAVKRAHAFEEWGGAVWRLDTRKPKYTRAFFEILVADAKKNPSLRAKAEALQIPIGTVEELAEYAGLSLIELPKSLADWERAGRNTPKQFGLGFGINLGAFRQASDAAGPLFKDSYNQLDKLMAAWLEAEYTRFSSAVPDMDSLLVRYYSHLREFSNVFEGRHLISKSREGLLAVVDHGSLLGEIGTVIRYSLPSEVRNGEALRDWTLQAARTNSLIVGYPGYSPDFAHLDPGKWGQELDLPQDDWSPSYRSSANYARDFLDLLITRRFWQVLHSHETFSPQEAAQAVLEEIQTGQY